jgi:hypothetical protein
MISLPSRVVISEERAGRRERIGTASSEGRR